jgi:hypothetical protein
VIVWGSDWLSHHVFPRKQVWDRERYPVWRCPVQIVLRRVRQEKNDIISMIWMEIQEVRLKSNYSYLFVMTLEYYRMYLAVLYVKTFL